MCLLIKLFYLFYSNYHLRFILSWIYFCINELKEIDRRVPFILIGIQLLNFFFWKRIYFLVPPIRIVLRCGATWYLSGKFNTVCHWPAWIYLQTHPLIFIYLCHKSEIIIIKLFERKVWKIVFNNKIFKDFRNMNSIVLFNICSLYVLKFNILYCVGCLFL